MASTETFYEELYQDVRATAQSEGVYMEDAFFDIVTDYLIDAGEFDEAIRAYYNPGSGSGIRVDGYCGDPAYSDFAQETGKGTLGLIVLDFNQDPEMTTLTNTEMEADFRRLEKFLKRARDIHFRVSLEPSDPGFGLADLIDTRWEEISRVKLFLLTNKMLSSRVDGKDVGTIDGREIVYNVWDISRFGNLVSSGREREPLVIDFNDLPGGPLRALLASAPDDPNEVFLAAVPGRDLAQIYDRWGTRLLEQNVRVFLQARSKVNRGIRRTIENEPEHFFSFNNGITATAEGVISEDGKDGLRITGLRNLQIVNGGQTTASVYAAYKSKKDLDKVYVQMKLSIVSPEDAKDLVPRISEYANSQNKVNAADFFSNHPYHQRIEECSRRIFAPAKDDSFDQTKWFYERARGSYADARAYLTQAETKKFNRVYPKSQTFTKTDLAKYLMLWTDKAYYVNRGAQKNFAEFAKQISAEWDKNEKRFNDVYFKTLVAKKIIFDRARKIIQSQDWYEQGGYLAPHTVYTVAAIANGASKLGKSVDFLAIWNQQDISPAFEAAIRQASDITHEVLMNPAPGYRNISEWAKQPKCWDEIRKHDIAWNLSWQRELIDKDEQRDIERAAVKDQRELSGIQAQETVLEAGSRFWTRVLDWCEKEGEGSDRERGVLRVASIPGNLPSEKQAIVLIKLMDRLNKEGCPIKLRKGRPSRARL